MLVGRSRNLRSVAIVHGIVGLFTCLSLIVFYVVEGPFGAINDVGNAVLGLLSAGLAWLAGGQGMRTFIVIAAVGAAITVVGSYLVLTDTTGYFLAGLVSSTGFALIGVWLFALNRSTSAEPWSRIRRAGLVAGAVMLLGFVNAPGIAMGLDDMATAPAWTYLGGFSWAGTYLLFPVWSLRLGRALAT
jgi:uncharacterized membrane protein (GlpM family)